MSWSGHWHGFGPWTGTRAEYGKEALRRPGIQPHDVHTRAFLASTLPPVQTGHALLRRSQASAERTWTQLADALHWLRSTYAQHPPLQQADTGGQAYLDLDTKLRYAADSLRRGSDEVWAYYTPAYSFVSYEVICCPHRFFPDLPCPCPPG